MSKTMNYVGGFMDENNPLDELIIPRDSAPPLPPSPQDNSGHFEVDLGQSENTIVRADSIDNSFVRALLIAEPEELPLLIRARRLGLKNRKGRQWMYLDSQEAVRRTATAIENKKPLSQQDDEQKDLGE